MPPAGRRRETDVGGDAGGGLLDCFQLLLLQGEQASTSGRGGAGAGQGGAGGKSTLLAGAGAQGVRVIQPAPELQLTVAHFCLSRGGNYAAVAGPSLEVGAGSGVGGWVGGVGGG